ncbi:UNVERIFIED_CONTAM: hypothetical protein O8I53_08575 [Campylobacter lari]
MQAKIAKTYEEGHQMVDKVIKNGKALEKFYEFVKLQGGDVEALKAASF